MCPGKRLSAEERKQEIMQAAARVIIEKGLSSTTMEDIIAETTMSKGGVYHYYKSTLDIFKDLMLDGVAYRNRIIKEHFDECKKGNEIEFFAEQMLDKILDDNQYIPLYVEFLIEKKRNSELNKMFDELKKQTIDSARSIMKNIPNSLIMEDSFNMITDFINAMILAADVLDARESFGKNRAILKEMLILLFKQGVNAVNINGT